MTCNAKPCRADMLTVRHQRAHLKKWNACVRLCAKRKIIFFDVHVLFVDIVPTHFQIDNKREYSTNAKIIYKVIAAYIVAD